MGDAGVYMVTAGTYQKRQCLNRPQRLELVMRRLFECVEEFGWELHAWAVLSNHTHSWPDQIAIPQPAAGGEQAAHDNSQSLQPGGRRPPDGVFGSQYWDSHITFERSYLARLRYINQNPRTMGRIDATEYRWCSAAWFERFATPGVR